MGEMLDRVERAIETILVVCRGEATNGFVARSAARAAIEAMRELPSDPGPRYTAGEYSRRTQDAMVDDALGKVDA